ncbi:MAG TPA: hypothetical protein VFU01_02555 [Gemmatimonadaceae bacterium]|nr:hypothetical protein [Gemmatimonadaceae bacterium]
MIARRARLALCLSAFAWLACDDAVDPSKISAPRFAASDDSRHTVVVNPNADGNGVVATIQEGVDMVGDGGVVKVVPGTYNERIVIAKGLILEPIGGGEGSVVIEYVRDGPAPNGLEAVITVATPQPVTIRDVTVEFQHLRGLNVLFTAADLTIENVSFQGRWPSAPPIINNGVSVATNAAQSGGRVRLAVRDSRFAVDGNAISLGGDVDALIERNEFRHAASNAGCVFVSPTGQGVTVPAGARTNVDILHNAFDDCGANVPSKLAAAVSVFGSLGATTTGTVNIVGNSIRTNPRTSASCNTAGISYEFYSGVIERNSLVDVVHDCATATTRSLPGGIFIGSRAAIRAANVSVRFNDIAGNAHAGLRIGSNQTTTFDATCNWWGDASGPSGVGPGTGDAIVVEAGAAPPIFTPFATGPIAATSQLNCAGGM